jgi:hypothetical protein
MSAGLTNNRHLISARNNTPWHGLGVVLKRHPRRLEDALRKSGLGWTVRQEPLYRRDKTTVDGWRANIRSDTREVLGVVTNRYTVIENREAFAFLANLLGSELAFETAGSLHGGKRVFVTIRTWLIEKTALPSAPLGTGESGDLRVRRWAGMLTVWQIRPARLTRG